MTETEKTGAGAQDWSSLDPASLTALCASGFDGAIGLEYLEVSADRVRATWTVTPSLHQPAGIQHGGVLCAVVESVASIGGSAWFGNRGHVVGTNNNTDFLRAAREGTLVAEGTPIHRGRTQQLWRVAVTDEAGKSVAEGKVRLANIPAPTGAD